MIVYLAAGFLTFCLFFIVTYAILQLRFKRNTEVSIITPTRSIDAGISPRYITTVNNDTPVKTTYQGTSDYTVLAQQNAALTQQLRGLETQLLTQRPQQVNYYITQASKTENKAGGNYASFITRAEIAQHIRSLGNTNITVKEHNMESQIPMSLKWKKSTYAMIYADDEGLLAILSLAEDYARELSKTHTGIHRPKFPKGQNWYTLKINHKTFANKDDVYKILDAARAFIELKPTSKAKTEKTEAPPPSPLIQVELKPHTVETF